MSESTDRRRVAIACQGGGSHTAFTAGVLSRCFEADSLTDHEFVGLSGASGAAVCALVAWSALVRGEPERASALLERFWSATSTSLPVERVLNSMMLWGSRVAEQFGAASLSPYDSFLSAWSTEHLRSMVRSVIDFETLDDLGAAPKAPLLLLGAVEVVSGCSKTFNSRAGEINADAVLAAAAIPSLLRSAGNQRSAYFDPMVAHNPPVRSLIDAAPDELWVIQVNPTSIDYEPSSVAEITYRRSELASNLALLQELGSIEMFDELIARGELKSERVRPITIRLLEMQRPPSDVRWSRNSKLNRDPRFIRELINLGKDQASDFLAAIAFEHAWQSRDGDHMLDHVAQGARICVNLPDWQLPLTRDPDAVERFFTEELPRRVAIDLTRKRVYRTAVTWEVRPDQDVFARGLAEVTFRDGLITHFALTQH
ncbi:MAG: patatin-like phospholipase family protein [Propionibacteriaceae bacterium]|nr:patatin-like phospholipase family protein [Propionibacteriaceae bacterium]